MKVVYLNEQSILYAAAKTWGADAQVNQAMEECAELIVALSKVRRADDGDKATCEKVIDNVCEELADVEIMCAQMRVFFVESLVNQYKTKKLKRVKSLLEKEGVEFICPWS